MECYLCGKDLGADSFGACEECKEKRKADKEQEKVLKEEAAAHVKTPKERMQDLIDPFMQLKVKELLNLPLPYVALIFIVVPVLGFPMLSSPRVLPDIQLTSSGEADPCTEKESCLICYMSPDCPACVESLPTLQIIRGHYANSPEVGVKVILGGAQMSALEEFGKDLGGGVFYDPESNFKSAAGVWSFPTLLHVTKDKQILKRHSGLPTEGEHSALVKTIGELMQLPT